MSSAGEEPSDSVREAFALARAPGNDEAAWLAMRERLAREIGFGEPPADAWRRYTAP